MAPNRQTTGMTANRSDQREPPRRMSGGAAPRQRPATTFDDLRRISGLGLVRVEGGHDDVVE